MATVSQKEGEPFRVTPQVYQVDRILQRGKAAGQTYYLVQWKGYSDAQATWEPSTNLSGCKQAIQEFERIIQIMNQEKITDKPQSYQNQAETKNKQKTQTIKSEKKPAQKQDQKQERPKQPRKEPTQPKKPAKRVKARQQIQRLRSKSQKQAKIQQNMTKKQNPLLLQDQDITSSSVDTLEATTAQTIPTKREKVQENNVMQRLGCMKEQIGKQVQKQGEYMQKQPTPSSKCNKIIVRQIPKLDNSAQVIQYACRIPKRSKQNRSAGETNPEEHDIMKKRVKISQAIDDQLHEYAKKADKTSNSFQQTKTPQVPIIDQAQHTNLKEHKQTSPNSSQPIQKGTLPLISVKKPQLQPKFKLSHRFLLCEQYFSQLKAQIIQTLFLSKNRSLLFQACHFTKITQILYEPMPDRCSQMLLAKFIDLSTEQSKLMNLEIINKLLLKQQVEKLDLQGEFLYAKFQAMIRIGVKANDIDNSSKEQTNQKQWICVMNCSSCSVKREVRERETQKTYLIRIDDIEQDVWRRTFRKFTLINKENQHKLV